MKKDKKKRDKKYRPRHINPDAHSWALAGATLQPPQVIEASIKIGAEAYAKIEADVATRHDWNVLAQTVAVSAVLAEMGIGPNLAPAIQAGQEALERIAIRMSKIGRAACHRDDLEAISEALAMYKIQLRLCTQAEWDRAIQRVTNLIVSGGFGRNRELYDAMVTP